MAVNFSDFQKLRWYYQLTIVLAVCGGFLGLAWYQFLAPIDAEITARTTQLAVLQGQIQKSIQQQRVFEQFKRESAALELELESLKSVLPLEKETDQLLRELSIHTSATLGEALNALCNLSAGAALVCAAHVIEAVLGGVAPHQLAQLVHRGTVGVLGAHNNAEHQRMEGARIDTLGLQLVSDCFVER